MTENETKEIGKQIGQISAANYVTLRAVVDAIFASSDINKEKFKSSLIESREATSLEFAKTFITDLLDEDLPK